MDYCQSLYFKQLVNENEKIKLNGNRPKNAVPETYILSFRNDVNRILDLCHSRGVKVLLTTYPTLLSNENMEKYPLMAIKHKMYSIYFSYKGSMDIVNRFNAEMKSLAAKRSLFFVDVAEEVPKSTLYFADCVHYTDQGSYLVARSIANYILSLRINEIPVNVATHDIHIR